MITNQANVNYTYMGARTPQTRNSNVTTLDIVPASQIELIKYPIGTTYIPGENHGYILRIENSGTTTLENVTLTDDLSVNTNLEYVEGSASFSYNNSPWASIIPTSITPLTFDVGTLEPGDVYEVVFLATTTSNNEVNTITNTATVTGTNNQETVSSEASSTITSESFARIEIVKSQSTSTPSIGEDFFYTLSLTNSGNIDATDILITDNLPNEFDLTSVELTQNGITTTLSPTDYTYENNILTIPSDTSSLNITIPAGESIFVTINGTFTQADDNINAPTV